MARKSYFYDDIIVQVDDETDVKFEVEVISDGDQSTTRIDLPNGTNFSIINSGSKIVGKGKDLRNGAISCVTDDANLADEEDKIEIRYKVNGKIIQNHSNLKSDEKRPMIYLTLKFPAQ